ERKEFAVPLSLYTHIVEFNGVKIRHLVFPLKKYRKVAYAALHPDGLHVQTVRIRLKLFAELFLEKATVPLSN
ncbi:MAG: hypothetical protein IJ386_08770, partial [Clostridia bacterium]|nr:hypothetical protein [Clostridia bacterium]